MMIQDQIRYIVPPLGGAAVGVEVGGAAVGEAGEEGVDVGVGVGVVIRVIVESTAASVLLFASCHCGNQGTWGGVGVRVGRLAKEQSQPLGDQRQGVLGETWQGGAEWGMCSSRGCGWWRAVCCRASADVRSNLLHTSALRKL